MRINSASQTKASRQNGAKSKGPVTTEGKCKVARNAMANGVFSRRVIIEVLGEKQEDFQKLRQSFREALQPSNVVEEQLVDDYVENLWRRERIRKAQTEELSERVLSTMLLDRHRKVEDTEALEARFGFLLDKYQKGISGGQQDHMDEIVTELQNIRKKLLSTIFGIDYLMEQLGAIKLSVEESGSIRANHEACYHACVGFNPMPHAGLTLRNPYTLEEDEVWNKALVEQMKKNAEDFRTRATPSQTVSAGLGTFGQSVASAHQDSKELEKLRCEVFTTFIDMALKGFKARRGALDALEHFDQSRAISLALIDPETSGRFSRAETATERRMYRSLAFLIAMRNGNIPNLLPVPKLPK